MPLTALPTITSIQKTDDGSVTNIADSTVYGGANPARAAVAVYLLAYKVDEELEETALVVQDYDEITANTFVVENTIDGHQKFILLIANNYDNAASYTQNQVVYYPSTGLLYKVTVAGPISGVIPTNIASWSPVTAQEIYASIDTSSEPSNVVVGITETVLTFKSQQCLGDKAIQNAKDNCCDGCSNPKAQQEFDELWLLVFTAEVASERQRYTEGEKFMRTAENYCDCDC